MKNDPITDHKQQRWLIFSASFAAFMVILDTYVVNISLPTIANHFHVTPGEVSWVVLSYMLTVTSTLLIFGKLGDRWGFKRIFILGFGVFTVGSLLCGISVSLGQLIGARVLQGIGGAMLYSMSPALISKLPVEKQGAGFGLTSTAAALGITVGTPLGGIISGLFSWHWVFLINIPVGVLAIFICHKSIPADTKEPGSQKVSFDFPGSAFSFLAILSLLFVLNQGDAHGWATPIIYAVLGVFLLMLTLFILWERRTAHPLLNFSLFKDPGFTFGNLASGVAVMFLAGNNFLMPFYLERVKGLKPQTSGTLIMVYSVVYMIVALVSGRIADKLSPRRLTIMAMIIGALNIFFLACFIRQPGLWPVVIFFVGLGISYAMFIAPNNKMIYADAPPGEHGAVAGTYRMVLNLSMVCGVCLFESVFSASFPMTVSGGTKDFIHISPNTLLVGFERAYFLGAILCLLSVIFSFIAGNKQKKKG